MINHRVAGLDIHDKKYPCSTIVKWNEFVLTTLEPHGICNKVKRRAVRKLSVSHPKISIPCQDTCTRGQYTVFHMETRVYMMYMRCVVQLCTCQHHVVFPCSYRPSSPQPSATSVCHPLPLTRVLTSSDIAVLRWGIEGLFIFSYFRL